MITLESYVSTVVQVMIARMRRQNESVIFDYYGKVHNERLSVKKNRIALECVHILIDSFHIVIIFITLIVCLHDSVQHR